MEIRLRKANEFNKFDWSTLEVKMGESRSWTIDKGGYGTDGKTWIIVVSVLTKNTAPYKEVWVLPNPLQFILNTVAENARKEAGKHLRGVVEGVINRLGLTEIVMGKEING